MLPALLLVATSLGLGVAAAAEDHPALPSVRASWKKQRGTLEVLAAPGTYLQQTAPVSGWWELGPTRVELRATGAELVDGLPLDLPADQRGIRGQLTVPVCDEGGTACRLTEVGFAGNLRGKKGRDLLLTPWSPPEAPAAEPAPHLPLDAAFAASAGDGKPVLIDFGAVWCPPCNRLEAEVLADPEDAELLSAVHLVTVDVDRVESWPVKSRYAVGGYPTVVAADAEGRELDRFVGYPSEAAFKAWLAGLSELTPRAELPAPDAVSGEEAARIAQRLARTGEAEAAGPYLLRAAAEGAHGVAYHEARVHVQARAEDIIWLAERDAPELLVWVWPALEVAAEDGAARAALLGAVQRALPGAEPLELADLLYCTGKLTEGEAARVAWLGAAQTLENALTGDPALDRGHWTGLAQVWERAGEAERAEALLVQAAATYPEEFTFHYALARLRLRLSEADTGADAEAAVQAAQLARAHAYGDNALRAVDVLARALHAAGRTPEARALLEETLRTAVRPEEGVDVRTPRYLKALEEQLAALDGGAAP